LILNGDAVLSTSAFKFNLRRYTQAGMDGVDKAKVQRVVYEMSKDSPHFANESRKEEAVERRIAEMKAAHARQGLTLTHFKAQLEHLLDTSLTLQLNLSTFGTHPRVNLG
jgi:hypothetical protein